MFSCTTRNSYGQTLQTDSGAGATTDERAVRRAAVVGIGTIGGSIAAALRKRGWYVQGRDADATRAEDALTRGFIDEVGLDGSASVIFVATPMSNITSVALSLLVHNAVITDVGSVKKHISQAVSHPRFVGGHPMAGSERNGLDGVDVDLFEGANWVLTPSATTDPESYLVVRNVVSELGANVVTLDAKEHDEIVATVSHVPHIAATALMTVALHRASEYGSLMRLAAGGFRDMTRIAAGDASLWADITLENREAVTNELGRLITGLEAVRELIANRERAQLEHTLGLAASARRELPVRAGRPAEMVVLHVVVPDRPGALGQVLGVFGALAVNVEDFEITHDPSGKRGLLHVTVGADGADKSCSELKHQGFVVTPEHL